MYVAMQWVALIAISTALFWYSPWARTNTMFFHGRSQAQQQPGVVLLTASLVISWIFAKSITNAADLGKAFGLVGGIAYAGYYLSFITAGIIIYWMRRRLQIHSLVDWIRGKYGRAAVMAFSLLVGIRLLNEVWSNTLVIGSYFGSAGSTPYYLAIVVFTVLTLAYSLKGGLRSSIVTDLIQMALFAIVLFALLALILPTTPGGVNAVVTSGEWRLSQGVNLLLVALLQIWSYPFHDPVMTDRGFIADEKKTLISFLLAGVIGIICITLFSFIGIYAQLLGLDGQATTAVAMSLGGVTMVLMNVIMVTSAASTLDSTFSSTAALAVSHQRRAPLIDDNEAPQLLRRGRLVMVLTAIGGSLPIFFSPAILSATTVSGTMVIGLAPIFLLWFVDAPKVSFHLSLWTGVAAGIVLVLGVLPHSWLLSSGKYADLLTINIYGTLLCFAGFLLPLLWYRGKRSVAVR